VPGRSSHDRPALDAAALTSAVVTEGSLWRSVQVLETVGSTNAVLAAEAAEGAPEGTVLVAEHQEAGRGRMTRSWSSPPGSGITVSVLLRPVGVSPSRFGWLPLLAGLAVLDTVREVSSAAAGLKWPNDVLLGHEPRKVAGILAEVADAHRPAVIIGIGVNVAAAPSDQPFATSLAAEGSPVEREEVLIALLSHLATREGDWRAARGDPERTHLRADYRAACSSLGSEVRVELPGGTVITGIAEDVDPDGRLLLLDPSGHRRAIAAGDVVHLRPAN
jgi:BirA family transcriptional regulator, biotin operon repressor / biotin---[acetyl-CoA-carboxylase] ligase